jgi:hypothetical protein
MLHHVELYASEFGQADLSMLTRIVMLAIASPSQRT